MPPRKLTSFVFLFGFAIQSILFVPTASAHFPWLATDGDGHAILFFGESPAERTYHLPEAVEKAEVAHVSDGKGTPLSLTVVDSEAFIGRRSASQAPTTGRLASTMTYGVYHGTKLTYYTQHELSLAGVAKASGSSSKSNSAKSGSEKPGSGNKSPASSAPLRAELTLTDAGGIAAQVFWNAKPLANAEVQLFCDEGHVEGKTKTDDNGFARFDATQIESGLNGLVVGHVVKNDSGIVDGKEHSSASHYLTVTFYAPSNVADSGKKTAALPPLPEPITSFGAAVVGGWLYVYGGHTGRAHVYSHETLSKHFVRTRVDGSSDWEKLPMDQPLQGLAMVAHGGKIYRVGGLDTRNDPGEEDDLHSVNSFACFDPATSKWIAMPSLPNGRSSHNAVVLGDTLYVVGGWQLSGDRDGEWQAGALAFDLTKPDSVWRKLPEPPFRRRALSVGHADGKLVVIGGMSDDQEITRETFFFDPAAGEWSAGPELPGGDFHGFGLAAWNAGGVLYAGGMEGVLYRLNEQLTEWDKAADFATPRFFHQLMPAGELGLLAIAGAAPDIGHIATIERLKP